MAETLGGLIDKLTIVDLKLWHCQEQLFGAPDSIPDDKKSALELKNSSLLSQRNQLIGEIDQWIKSAVTDPDSVTLTFPQNKMYGQYRKD